MTSQDVLMFSCGFNGYGMKYSRCVTTQREYALRMGFTYRLFDYPGLIPSAECKWLKIPIMMRALQDGWPLVFFVDVDCEMRPSCPDVRILLENDKDLYFAHGFSGRINSGVILARNSTNVCQLLQTVADEREKKLPPEDGVADGENGHVIHFAKNKSYVQIIDGRWNNNREVRPDDYIRHYTGPLAELAPKWKGKGLITRAYARLRSQFAGVQGAISTRASLSPSKRLYALAELISERNAPLPPGNLPKITPGNKSA
jgi:hypothetical protein